RPWVLIALRRDGHVQWLREADVVAKWVAETAVDAIGSFGRLLGELDALRPKFVVGLPAVRRGEEQVATGRALGHQLAGLLGRLRIEPRRTRRFQQDLACIARNV